MEPMAFVLDVVLMGAGTLLAVYGAMALVATLLFRDGSLRRCSRRACSLAGSRRPGATAS